MGRYIEERNLPQGCPQALNRPHHHTVRLIIVQIYQTGARMGDIQKDVCMKIHHIETQHRSDIQNEVHPQRHHIAAQHPAAIWNETRPGSHHIEAPKPTTFWNEYQTEAQDKEAQQPSQDFDLALGGPRAHLIRRALFAH